MRMYDIINKKKNGHELSKEEIFFWVQGLTEGLIPDYQTTALLMAIYFQGLTLKEISIIIKLSEARISQLHTKAIFRLRGALSRLKASIL